MKTNCLILIIFFLSINLFGQEKYYSSEKLENELDYADSFIEGVQANLHANVSKEVILSMMDSAKSEKKDSLSIIDFYTINSPIVSSLNDDHIGDRPYVEWKLLKPHCLPFNPEIENNKKLLLVTVKGETIHFSACRFQLLKIFSLLYEIRSSGNTISDLTVNIVWSTN